MLSFNTTIIMCILLGVMLISRVLVMVLSHHQLQLNWARYVYWEIAELVAMSMFMALYLTLMYKGAFPYFHVVGQSLYALLILCIYPYVIFNLSVAYMAQKEEQATYDDSLMRFVDNTQRVKLMIASSAVLYIKAEENYVHIRYMEDDDAIEGLDMITLGLGEVLLNVETGEIYTPYTNTIAKMGVNGTQTANLAPNNGV